MAISHEASSCGAAIGVPEPMCGLLHVRLNSEPSTLKASELQRVFGALDLELMVSAVTAPQSRCSASFRHLVDGSERSTYIDIFRALSICRARQI